MILTGGRKMSDVEFSGSIKILANQCPAYQELMQKAIDRLHAANVRIEASISSKGYSPCMTQIISTEQLRSLQKINMEVMALLRGEKCTLQWEEHKNK